MKVLFARVGYMHYYSGSQANDERPVGGGSYNQDNIGHEVYNFRNVEGILRGYYQPYWRDGMSFDDITSSLEKIDPELNTAPNYIDNVLVIFFASTPHVAGQCIIGWYNNARVYRNYQQTVPDYQRGDFNYNFECEAGNAVLLPESLRTYQIAGQGLPKRSRPGQSNAFYLYDNRGNPKSDEWIQQALTYVEQHDDQINLLQDSERFHFEETTQLAEKEYADSTGQAFNSSLAARKALEDHSMAEAKIYFEEQGYQFVADRSANHSYDLEFIKEGKLLFVEVKGSQTSGKKVFLTRNEVIYARNHPNRCALYVLHSIVLTTAKGKVMPKGGQCEIKLPWHPEEESLKVVTYQYTL